MGITVDGAARNAWQPDVFGWVAGWRALVVLQGFIAALLPVQAHPDLRTLLAGGVWAGVSYLLSGLQPEGRARVAWLVVDLVACMALLAMAPNEATFALMALYSYSTVAAWASGRPIDAFIAAGVGAGGYLVIGLTGPASAEQPSAFVSNLVLYFFFALATSGFFTVARRIGALEIATEISRERGRYRRDLHDRLGQALCGLHFELQAVRATGVSDGVDQRLLSLADGYRDAESMLADLFRQGDEPMVATDVGSVISQEARRLQQQSGVAIDVQVDGDASRVPPWMRPHVVAISGEGMTNALKYGEASQIDVQLDVLDDIVVLSVTDDGVGFDNPPGTLPEKIGHYGLREMAERARICGGEVVIASQHGFGTRVRLQVPLPEGGTDDIIERDAGTLRRNVWTLVTVLRTGLGVVALLQLTVGATRGDHASLLIVMGALMLADIGAGVVWRKRAFAACAARPRLLAIPVVGYVAGSIVAIVGDVVPYFMLYAPLVLLAAGIHGGRRLAARLTVAWAGAMVTCAVVGDMAGLVSAADAETVLLQLTTMVIIGMSAVTGATLLDRLETLQIRVRYQTLARLRQGLSNRMRDELAERLEALEHSTRELAVSVPDAEHFSEATQVLEVGSSELKGRLREIVHQLADPTPGRTAPHV